MENPEEAFEVTELDDHELEDVAGGGNSGCTNTSGCTSTDTNCTNTACGDKEIAHL